MALIHGTYFIPSSIPFYQVFSMIYGRFLILYPGLFHSSMEGISFNISFLCGKFSFIHSFSPWVISFNISFCMADFSFIYFILALGYFIQYFIPHGRFIIHSFHPCHGIFHSVWQVFHSFTSSLPWDISFCVAGFSFIHFILALGYFILHGRFFIHWFHPCPGIFHSVCVTIFLILLCLPMTFHYF